MNTTTLLRLPTPDEIKILQAYGQVHLPTELRAPLNQDFLVTSIINNDHFLKHRPSQTFERTFWKWVIHNLESAGDEEVNEAIYNQFIGLLESSSSDYLPDTPRPGYTTYLVEPPEKSKELREGSTACLAPGHCTFTLLEARTTAEGGTTGLRTWQASLILGDFLLRNPDIVKGRVLELGSGAGLLGIIVASLHQKVLRDASQKTALYLTDIGYTEVNYCRSNMELAANDLSQEGIAYRTLDWRDALKDSPILEETIALLKEIQPDIVLGADIVYDVSVIPALSSLVHLVLQILEKPPRLLFALTYRRKATIDLFLSRLEKLGLHVVVESMRPLKSTIFTAQVRDVDGEAVIKLVHISR